jgi:hypothetical protein
MDWLSAKTSIEAVYVMAKHVLIIVKKLRKGREGEGRKGEGGRGWSTLISEIS